MAKLPMKRITREVIEHQIKYWTDFLAVWDKCVVSELDDFDTKVYKMYIRIGTVIAVMEELKNQNQWPRGRDTTFISNILREGHISDKEIEFYGKELQEKNMTVSRRING